MKNIPLESDLQEHEQRKQTLNRNPWIVEEANENVKVLTEEENLWGLLFNTGMCLV